jgi:hypothetical protein
VIALLCGQTVEWVRQLDLDDYEILREELKNPESAIAKALRR